jgi:hypothetical protein
MDEGSLLATLMAEVSQNTIYSRIGTEKFIQISTTFYDKLFAIAPSMWIARIILR